MKKRTSLNILILAVALLIVQACGPKSEKTNDENVANEAATVKEEVAPTLAEKRAKIEKERAAREEKRRIEFEERAKLNPTYTDAEGNIVYNKAELNPSFEGGNDAMMKYLRDNLKFPKEAEERGLEGTVFVDFIVAANGSVREVMVIDDTQGEEVDQSFRSEAIRVVTAMPKWVPGRQRGKPVDVKFSLPITFQMI